MRWFNDNQRYPIHTFRLQHYLYTMPLLKEWNIGATGRGAIWKIEEPESFFLERTGMQLPEIKAEKRRVERMAGRFLLMQVEAEFPIHTITKDEHDKPRIPENAFHFSISHSWPYVAVAVDTDSEAGIDIQTWTPQIERIKDKFLSPAEQEDLCHDLKYYTLGWCAKEAVYKWMGRRGIDFKQHMPIAYFSTSLDINIYIQQNKISQMVFTKNFITADFACSYVDNAIDWAIY